MRQIEEFGPFFVLDHPLHARIALHMLAVVIEDARQGSSFLCSRIDSKPATGMMQIDEYTTIFHRDGFQ